MDNPRIPNQQSFNKPQGPSVMDQLPLEYQAVVKTLLAILDTLNRIEITLKGGTGRVPPDAA